jgi:tetratricopeptide (TPR) repeat protein
LPTDTGSWLYFLGDGLADIAIAGGFLIPGYLTNNYRALQTSSQIIQGLLTAGLFTNAIKTEPNLGNAYLFRGFSFLEKEDFKNALADIDEALKIDTGLGSLRASTELGFLKLRFNDLDAAEFNFNKALDKDYLDARANYGLAATQYSTGKIELSLRHFEQAFIPRKLDYDAMRKDPWMKKIVKDKDFKKLVKAYVK